MADNCPQCKPPEPSSWKVEITGMVDDDGEVCLDLKSAIYDWFAAYGIRRQDVSIDLKPNNGPENPDEPPAMAG